jgi:hypothetical protein
MPYRLLAMYETEQKKKGAAIPHFQTEAPYTTLSEYMDGSHLNLLISCIREQLTKDIDGSRYGICVSVETKFCCTDEPIVPPVKITVIFIKLLRFIFL